MLIMLLFFINSISGSAFPNTCELTIEKVKLIRISLS